MTLNNAEDWTEQEVAAVYKTMNASAYVPVVVPWTRSIKNGMEDAYRYGEIHVVEEERWQEMAEEVGSNEALAEELVLRQRDFFDLDSLRVCEL